MKFYRDVMHLSLVIDNVFKLIICVIIKRYVENFTSVLLKYDKMAKFKTFTFKMQIYL